ncbi:MAG: SPOR domain-containing protein [Planktomarina sp.]|uniref:SPOR domain-containing protein n=1 Tax=Planktomarina sp. TaxID=2024851 RepID=UPI003C33D641
MANATYEAQGDSERFNPAAYANIVGAVISLAVFVGIVTWGAKTVLRDSSGVPVVRALEGPARVAPEDPGGLLVAHQGLTVNEVAGSQITGAVDDPLQLAPRPINLQAEDQPIQPLVDREIATAAAPAAVVLPEPEMDAAEALIIDETAESLAAMLAAGTDMAPVKEPASAVIPASAGGGPIQSLRPRVRPFAVFTRQTPRVAPRNIPAAQIVRGAPMAQLGAFGSAAIAEQAWADLSERHGDYLVGKPHVILQAAVGGGTIYRLRVHGFENQEEARRLCTALNRQNAECYSVTMN